MNYTVENGRHRGEAPGRGMVVRWVVLLSIFLVSAVRF